MSLEFDSDLHTHTIYSHGRGSVEDNVKAAIEKGLSEIGISDHGPAHIGFGVSRKKLAEIKAEIVRLRGVYPQIKILFGVEANIIAPAGTLDIKENELDYFDYIVAGWHYGAFDGMTPAGIVRTLENFSRRTVKKASHRQIRRNTDAIVHALETYDFMFLAHPGGSAPIDILEVAAACARTNTFMEINAHHKSMTPEDIRSILLTDVRFIVSSDAHSPKRVGDFGQAIRLIEETGMDPSRIVNLKSR